MEDYGVIIGRFQVSKLHDGHKELIDTVRHHHNKVIVLLGCSPLPNSFTNPLGFQAREVMLKAQYPDLLVLPIHDCLENSTWSNNVDNIISGLMEPNSSPILYGSRDSFIQHYTGRYKTKELLPSNAIDGTSHRTEIARSIPNSEDYRAGLIYASQHRFPTCYTCVDIAILTEDHKHILLGNKAGESLFRFPGGFSDPISDSFEKDAIREAWEETNLMVQNLQYLGSTIIDDWRYRKEPDCIKTLIFLTDEWEGELQAGDDLEAVSFQEIEHLKNYPIFLMPGHRHIFKRVCEYLSIKKD